MLSIYEHAPAQFEHGLQNLLHLLKKAEHFLAQGAVPESQLLDARLAEDMYPLLRQVQLSCDFAKGAVSRLAGRENPVMPDEETSFAQLYQRIENTLAYVKSFQASDFANSEQREIELQGKSYHLKMTAQKFLLAFALPNFYFHLTTAYNILRNQGVEIGKKDFLGMS
ncbi:DUF1993 domain-containing protein [Serratia microhaemolytica]|uniref:DUF1993 domain-containing protein n=1 Tax=Serratia microhaemolytica TaxID=2675110 RepID=UPI000FDDE480|nr:DUF1993 domain-containing protein [Serratia microhaemolytica]